MNEVIYTCDACHYIFSADEECNQCPDCGKKQVRPADKAEIQEYLNRQNEPSDWN